MLHLKELRIKKGVGPCYGSRYGKRLNFLQGGANVEELLYLLAQLDVEQRRIILEYIKSLLSDPGCRSFLLVFSFLFQ